MITRRFSTSLLILHPPEKRRSPSWEMMVRRSLMRSVDERGNDSMDQSPPRDFSNTVRRPSLPAWSKAPGCPFSLLWSRECSPVAATNPCVWRMCDFLPRTHTHTPPTPVHTHRSERSASRHSAPLPRHPLYIHIKLRICSTHTHIKYMGHSV